MGDWDVTSGDGVRLRVEARGSGDRFVALHGGLRVLTTSKPRASLIASMGGRDER